MNPQSVNRDEPQGEPVRTSFRPMKEADIPTVCAIEIESFPTPWTEGAFRNELTSNNFAHYVIMEDADTGAIAGYGGMWLILEEAHVTNVAVRAPYRGRGLGERLMRELMSKASFLGALRMTLEVRQSNRIAQALYKKIGFHAVGLRRGYYTDNNEDAVIMWADLPKARRSP